MVSKQHCLRIFILMIFATLFTFDPTSPVRAQSTSKNDTIRVLILENFPPQFISTPDGPSGLAVEVVREVARRASLNIEFVTVKGWKDVYAPLENRTVDVLSNMGVTEARQKLVEFTEPYEVFDYKLFVRRETRDLETLANLNGRMLGVQDTNFLTKGLVKSGKYNIKFYSSFHAAFLGLLAGEIDAIPAPTEPFLLIARAARLDDRIMAVGPSLHEVKRAMAVPKGRTELRDRLNKGLNEFKNTAEYQSLLSKWYGTPTPYWSPVKIFFVMGSVLISSLLIMGVWRYYSIVGLNHNLQQSESEYRNILNTMIDTFYRTDLEGYTIVVSPSIQKLLGYTPEEVIGTKLAERYADPDGREKFMTDLAEANGVIVGQETQLRKKDGSVIWVQTNSQYYYDRDGQVVGVEGIARDITETRKAQKALKDANQLNEIIFSGSPIGIATYDSTGQCNSTNDRFCHIIGAIRDQVLSQNYHKIESWKKGGLYDKVLKCLSTNERIRHEMHVVSSFGMEIYLDCHLVTILVNDERHLLLMIDNTTEHKVLEEQLLHSQKMEAIGQLTGGLAHDFNNILGVIMGNLEIVQNMDSRDQRFLNHIERALKGVNRGADITRKLLDFSRKDEHGKILSSINQLIESQKYFIAKSLTASIKVETHLADDLWTVSIDPGDLEDTILNLSLNARDAMPDGGILTIETANKVLDDSYVKLNPESEVGEFVMIAVSDNGMGMTEETKEKVFDPFFTTKEQGKGTGLGLSMVYGFVQRSGGHLKVYSEVGKGTTIRLYLPRAHEEADVDGTANDARAGLPRGTETILVVDDEDELLSIAVSFMKTLGYRILSATSAEQAIQVLKDNKDIDLMFSDVIMPGDLNGYQLALTAHKDNPALKILLTSGFTKKHDEYDNNNYNSKYLARLTANLLNKPYNLSGLALAVRRTLDKEA